MNREPASTGCEAPPEDDRLTLPAWHVLHVRPRCEKKMALYCRQHAFRCELPLRDETKIYQRRRVTVSKPLFPGYIFIFYAPMGQTTILRSQQVVRVVPVPDPARLEVELDVIRRALEVDPTLGACEAFTAGRLARIKQGPFMGLEGVVQIRHGRTRVILNVEMIGQATSVEVEMTQLELMD